MKKLILCAAMLVSATFAASAQTNCGYQYCWGAIAFNPNTGAYGWAHSYFSEGEAWDAAAAGCSYNCPEVHTFYNQCAAAAIGANGGYGYGFGASQGAAQNVAMSYCNNYDYGCQVLVWSCSR